MPLPRADLNTHSGRRVANAFSRQNGTHWHSTCSTSVSTNATTTRSRCETSVAAVPMVRVIAGGHAQRVVANPEANTKEQILQQFPDEIPSESILSTTLAHMSCKANSLCHTQLM
ncbi:hypothetical protein MJO28_001151 [Puccinia striiformis f. sp. tritici]|uniref:Uncharacterized protein n=1 Tax=Puccinia striiformis f. sp. tritici TaxID=168172 RepID=A0ACC0F084_9BASI|nr:hypothetical protein MJO28_001151 [Puccinia striiformis f. sp. tritici]KAI7966817.1 hypothetical protein MJO29_000094 [Puccinia striiformis f. sp. tritici]